MSHAGIPILEAHLHHLMYELSIRVTPPCSPTQALMVASFRPGTLAEEHQSIQIWHQHLCHLNYAAVRRLATSDTVNGIRFQQDSSTSDLFYEGCCKGKQHCTSFSENIPRTRAFQPGALLHADLFGPIDPPSQTVRQVLRDTGYAVKVIRSDRGGEFINKDAAKFYEENLIC